MVTVAPGVPRQGIPPQLAAERAAFYAELPGLSMGPLWNTLANTMSREPKVSSVPHIWRWSEVRPQVIRGGELVTAEEAERRVLMLLNPGTPPDKLSVVGNLYAGVQLILPNEVARTHHHTPNALRFIIEGSRGFTSVTGEQTLMEKGDYVTTPTWAWHDHGNVGDQPMMWLDGLDLPFVLEQDAMFFEEFAWSSESGGSEVLEPRRFGDDSLARWGANMRPTWQEPLGNGLYSPVLNYRWKTSRGALHALREDPGSPYDGVILAYVNPQTGGPTLPTISSYLQLLRASEHTRAHRHVASAVYHVAEGRGYSIIAGQRFDWTEGDTFCVPAWAWHEHVSDSGEAILFSYTNRPVLQHCGLEREEPLAADYQS